MTAVTLERRLANFRAAVSVGPRIEVEAAERRERSSLAAAERLVATVGGEIVRGRGGAFVRLESSAVALPVDREALARLPFQPTPDRPLLCLDTETTGLATAAGTIAFLVGLGWWEADRFRTVQLLLPDHADEAALLAELASVVPGEGWLVTYNGRGFDWPLLTTRFRMHRHDAPGHAGHLDLLPLVRRIYRHRLPDARLRTVETHLLGVQRHHDVEGWEIPGRYFDVLRGGPAELLVDVLRHNAEDVRSLARLVSLMATGLGDRAAWDRAPAGDLAGLGRAYRVAGRPEMALACLDVALAADGRPAEPTPSAGHVAREEAAWWLGPADLPWGLRPAARPWADRAGDSWTEQRLLVERAHILRRLGRHDEAAESWVAVAAGPGRLAPLGWLEVAKLRERRLGDLPGALAATERARIAVDKRRRLGLPEPRLEAAIDVRLARLRRRLRVA